MTSETIPYGFCHCGCGGLAPIAPDTHRARGYVKGEPRRFIKGHMPTGRDRRGLLDERYFTIEDRGYTSPCWIWKGSKNHKGYGQTYSWERQRHMNAARVVYEQRKGPFSLALVPDHLCYVTACVNPDHIEPVTPLVNSRRRRDAKLTDADRDEIVRRRLAGETCRAIAQDFGVNHSLIPRLVNLAQRPAQAPSTGKDEIGQFRVRRMPHS